MRSSADPVARPVYFLLFEPVYFLLFEMER